MILPLALTMGEPAGIGGEIALKAWLRRGEGVPAFYVIDDPGRLAALAARLGWRVPIGPLAVPHDARAMFADALPVLPIGGSPIAGPGRPDPADAPLVIGAIDAAVADVRGGRAGAVVTNPINKDALYRAGFRHPGHTEYLAELAGTGASAVMMLAGPELRVVPVTIHLALREAIEQLSARRSSMPGGSPTKRWCAISGSPGRSSPAPGSTRMPANRAPSAARISTSSCRPSPSCAPPASMRGGLWPPTRCSMPRRGPVTTPPCACTTTRR